MAKMSISVFPDGHVEHTLRDKVLKLSSLGPRSIERMSEILFDEEKQSFYIRLLKGPYAGVLVNAPMLVAAILGTDPFISSIPRHLSMTNATVWYPDYESAVADE